MATAPYLRLIDVPCLEFGSAAAVPHRDHHGLLLLHRCFFLSVASAGLFREEGIGNRSSALHRSNHLLSSARYMLDVERDGSSVLSVLEWSLWLVRDGRFEAQAESSGSSRLECRERPLHLLR
ncbi:hypothetical protein Bca52824_017679 [Brassica carinata]|uniref:Uncharacterized protein n=1 Tax=Brassica carinata TaxID=52824 RepID=A0A8X8AXM5_BRACI|nr:hypothetical protein Bca52824_017679 [Brassica carinata]